MANGASRRRRARVDARAEARSMDRILVTGAAGQIGSELVPALRQRYGAEKVVASDIRMTTPASAPPELFEQLDCTKPDQIHETIRRYDVKTIFHLAAMLSASAEEKPQAAWELNMSGLYNVLEICRQNHCALFF